MLLHHMLLTKISYPGFYILRSFPNKWMFKQSRPSESALRDLFHIIWLLTKSCFLPNIKATIYELAPDLRVKTLLSNPLRKLLKLELMFSGYLTGS